MSAVKKNETINLRMDAKTRDVISRAAEICGKSLTSFMTEAAYFSAQKELLDQRFVGVDAKVFDAVEDMLAEPARVNDRLVDLFKSNREWID
ncbi:DUF1778 domain-containing protein [Rhizobium sp. TRM95111]|uniref:type II toxin-antitoxin system TacA family antitoxin n=1 Tax=Rhizobium alarense TaxID=2846851 RepID=UPI001F3C8290|nr:DUF1778 domain-containing protein [Rhizobium alarense]MCF3642635.1 DUF1778 domain-containing protein [Rhizobium alarense]